MLARPKNQAEEGRVPPPPGWREWEEGVFLEPRVQGPGELGPQQLCPVGASVLEERPATSRGAAWAESEGRSALVSRFPHSFTLRQCLLLAGPIQKLAPRGVSETQPAALGPPLLSGPEPGQGEQMREGQTGPGLARGCKQILPSQSL